MQGDIPAALPPLEQALTLAEPEGYVRMFLDEGASMAGLLSRSCRRAGSLPGYTGKLLAAFETEAQTSTASADEAPLPTPHASQLPDRAAQPA